MDKLYFFSRKFVKIDEIKMINFYRKNSITFSKKYSHYRENFDELFIYSLDINPENTTTNISNIDNEKLLIVDNNNNLSFKHINITERYTHDDQYNFPYPFYRYNSYLKNNFFGIDATNYKKYFDDEFLNYEGFIWNNKNLKKKININVEDHLKFT